jgi:hypothetical protein
MVLEMLVGKEHQDQQLHLAPMLAAAVVARALLE